MADQSERATSTAVAEPPAPAAPAASAPAPASSEGSPAPEGTQPTAAPDLDALIDRLTPEQKLRVLKSMDADEAIRLDDRLSGKLGKLAQQQAQKEVERLLPQYLEREKPRLYEQWQIDAGLRDLQQRKERAVAAGDYAEALEALKAEGQLAQTYAQRQQAEASRLPARQLDAAWERARAFFLSDEVPEEVRKPLYGKQYGTDPAEALHTFWRDINAGLAEHRASEKATKELLPALEQKLRDELTPALRKELLAEINGRDPSPDTGGGTPPVGNTVTQTEYDAHKHDRAWVRQNRDRIKNAMFAGRLHA